MEGTLGEFILQFTCYATFLGVEYVHFSNKYIYIPGRKLLQGVHYSRSTLLQGGHYSREYVTPGSTLHIPGSIFSREYITPGSTLFKGVHYSKEVHYSRKYIIQGVNYSMEYITPGST